MIGLLAMDREGRFEPAVKLLGRLSFDKMRWHAVHVEPQFTPVGSPFLSGDEIGDAMERDRADATEFVQDTIDRLCHYDIVPTVHVMQGAVAASILDVAEKENADIVAIGSRHSGRVASILLGSVGRALAIGAKQSVLIGRSVVGTNGPLSAVFATDHSAYANRAINHLLAMKPNGLKEVTLVTAYEPNAKKDEIANLRSLGELAARRFRAEGIKASYELKPGNVRDVIHRAMAEHNADLLIIGAQGHGFFDRVFVGSAALQQVVAEPHSILIIRA